jgi:hypothetical protein
MIDHWPSIAASAILFHIEKHKTFKYNCQQTETTTTRAEPPISILDTTCLPRLEPLAVPRRGIGVSSPSPASRWHIPNSRGNPGPLRESNKTARE